MKPLPKILIALILTFSLIQCTSSSSEQSDKHSGDGLFRESRAVLKNAVLCGTVQFDDGCSPQLDSLIAYGLALTHHMTYDDAAEVFQSVNTEDPDCFWGHWGKALTYVHPLWPDVPSADYWINRMEIQHKVVEAWNQYTSGDQKLGLVLMEEAADMEDKTEKIPVTPGELLPAKELLGDMYLDAGTADKAFSAYEASLSGNPNRCNTYYGAAMSAEKAGHKISARKYYQKILDLATTDECRKEVIDRAKKATQEVI